MASVAHQENMYKDTSERIMIAVTTIQSIAIASVAIPDIRFDNKHRGILLTTGQIKDAAFNVTYSTTNLQ